MTHRGDNKTDAEIEAEVLAWAQSPVVTDASSLVTDLLAHQENGGSVDEILKTVLAESPHIANPTRDDS